MRMNNVMIYTIEHYLYIQSSEFIINAQVELIGEDCEYFEKFEIDNSCYEKIVIDAPQGKYKVKLTTKDIHLEKQILIINQN